MNGRTKTTGSNGRRRRRPYDGIVVWVMLLAIVPWIPAAAQEMGSSPAKSYFTDVMLVDQDGREHRFYSDLLQGRVVVIGSFFATCTGACPAMAKTYKKIQDWLGDRQGKEVFLLSITVDPEHDTPQRLKEFAQEFGARPGWIFLTGSKENVSLALQKLGSFVENKEAHNNLLFIGNEPTGLWKKAFGLAPSEELIPIVRSVLEDKG